jgi:hypothetical protein
MNTNDSNNNLDCRKACVLLEINLLNIQKLKTEDIKKQYHKLALKNHPDKNGNTIESTKKFQEIKRAYEYLMNDLGFDNDNDLNNENTNTSTSTSNEYVSLLSLFISNIIKNSNYKEIITNTIVEILNISCKEISLNLFDKLEKETCLEILCFLNKYKTILYINSDIIENIKIILINKFSKDQIFIINPSLDDLFENNIFKLMVDEQMYLVPLWHSELYFSSPEGNDIIVFCYPELPKNIYIDENNNLHMDLYYEKEKMYEIIHNKFIPVKIGKTELFIEVENLFIRRNQMIIFKKQGISQIDETDIYNTNNKGNIYINILLDL